MSDFMIKYILIRTSILTDLIRYLMTQRQFFYEDACSLRKEIDLEQSFENIANLFETFSDRKSNKSAQSKRSGQNSPASQKDKKQQVREEVHENLINIYTSEQLESDFKENKNIMESLNCNIDNLFKKISQLTDQVQKDLRPTRTSIEQNCEQVFKKQRQSLTFYVAPKLQKVRSSPRQQTKRYQLRQLKHASSLNSQYQYRFPLVQVKTDLSISNFQAGKTLGYGKFGEAFICRHKETGYLYAIKKIFKSTLQQYKMEDQMLKQIKALKRLNHKSIVKVYNAFCDEFFVFLLLQLAMGKPLTKKFKSSQKQVALIIKQVLQAIKHMHEQGIIHRDIKPENILYDQETQQIKICDLGWSSIDGKDLNIICGTLDYICPQMTENKQYSNSVDLWCVGVLTFQLLFGYAPFRAKEKSEIFQRIQNIDIVYPKEIEVSDEAKNFMQGFMAKQQVRESAQWGLKHPFIAKHSQISVEDHEISCQLELLL